MSTGFCPDSHPAPQQTLGKAGVQLQPARTLAEAQMGHRDLWGRVLTHLAVASRRILRGSPSNFLALQMGKPRAQRGKGTGCRSHSELAPLHQRVSLTGAEGCGVRGWDFLLMSCFGAPAVVYNFSSLPNYHKCLNSRHFLGN